MFKISLIERTRGAYSKHSSLSTKSWQKLAERKRQEWKFQHYCIGLREVTDYARTCPHQNSILLLCPCRKWSEKMHYNEKHRIFKQQTLDWKQAVVSVSRLPWVYWGCVWTKITWSNTSSLIKPKVTWNKAKERAVCQVLNLFCLWVFKIYDGGTKHVYKSLLESRKRERSYSMIGKPKHPGWTTAHS